MSDHANLRDAILHFSEFENCRQFMVALRWADGKVKCPECGSEKVCYLAKNRLWKCYAKHPKPRFTLKTGTIFEDSPIALEKWLPAVWMLLNCENGMSSWELHRALGVTQKTAWFMFHRIRLAAQNKTFNKLAGEIEVDESFIGGKSRNMHADKREEKIHGRRPDGKTTVAAVLERSGTVRAHVCNTRRKPELQAIRFKPAIRLQRVRGNVHTNGLENFWSLLKRGLEGTYVSVEPFRLFRYLDEQAFRSITLI